MAPASNWAEGPRDIVAVLAKSPHPGRVKTRMCPPLDPHQAAELYGAMLADVLAATESFAVESGLDPVLCVDPPRAVSEKTQLFPFPPSGPQVCTRSIFFIQFSRPFACLRLLTPAFASTARS